MLQLDAPDRHLEALQIALSAIDICTELCRKMGAPRTADELDELRKDICHTLHATAHEQPPTEVQH